MSLKLSEKEAQNKLKRAASAASVALAAALTLLKVAAAVYTGSLAVLSSMIDSLADIFCLVNYVCGGEVCVNAGDR